LLLSRKSPKNYIEEAVLSAVAGFSSPILIKVLSPVSGCRPDLIIKSRIYAINYFLLISYINFLAVFLCLLYQTFTLYGNSNALNSKKPI